MRHANYRENYAPESVFGPYERETPTGWDLVRLWLSGLFLGFTVALLIL